MKRPLAYITAPWSNSQYENAENAAAYCRQVYDAGYSPICPVLFLPTFLKDEIPQEHKDGLDMARDYLRRSHVLVLEYGTEFYQMWRLLHPRHQAEKSEYPSWQVGTDAKGVSATG